MIKLMDCLGFGRFVENCLMVGNSWQILPFLNVKFISPIDLNYKIMMI
jgi:hypothetical protein